MSNGYQMSILIMKFKKFDKLYEILSIVIS